MPHKSSFKRNVSMWSIRIVPTTSSFKLAKESMQRILKFRALMLADAFTPGEVSSEFLKSDDYKDVIDNIRGIPSLKDPCNPPSKMCVFQYLLMAKLVSKGSILRYQCSTDYAPFHVADCTTRQASEEFIAMREVAKVLLPKKWVRAADKRFVRRDREGLSPVQSVETGVPMIKYDKGDLQVRDKDTDRHLNYMECRNYKQK